MRIPTAISIFALTIGLVGCSSSDQEQAKKQAREDAHEAADEAKRAGHEIKEGAKELNRRAKDAMQPDSQSASDKMSQAEAKAKDAAAHAGVKLDHAALLAKVKTSLASNAGLSTVTSVDVTVDGSVVTLSGTVPTDNQKKAAEMAASQVDGVTQVHNNLTLQP
jgi:hyperosmotically inducible periplasmic protein